MALGVKTAEVFFDIFLFYRDIGIFLTVYSYLMKKITVHLTVYYKLKFVTLKMFFIQFFLSFFGDKYELFFSGIKLRHIARNKNLMRSSKKD